MNERLRELRSLLNLNQAEFAAKIGIKQGSLSDIERGRVGLSNVVLGLICKSFAVNEEWLREGIGKPFKNEYAHRQDLTDLEKEILSKFNLLNPAQQKAVSIIIDGLYLKEIEE